MNPNGEILEACLCIMPMCFFCPRHRPLIFLCYQGTTKTLTHVLTPNLSNYYSSWAAKVCGGGVKWEGLVPPAAAAAAAGFT